MGSCGVQGDELHMSEPRWAAINRDEAQLAATNRDQVRCARTQYIDTLNDFHAVGMEATISEEQRVMEIEEKAADIA
jgi:glucokinase